MTNRKFTLAAAALATLVGAGTAVTLPAAPALAQQSAPSAPPPGQPPHHMPQMRPSHIDGRVAYVKAELHVTPAQESQWDKVAQAMRQNDTERRQAFQQMLASRGMPETALQRLERKARFSAMRAQQTDRFLAAFRPLYDGMSDTQKQTANDLFAPHHFGHGHHGRG